MLLSAVGVILDHGQCPQDASLENLDNGFWTGSSGQGFAGSGMALKVTRGSYGFIISQANGGIFFKSKNYDGTWSSWIEAK